MKRLENPQVENQVGSRGALRPEEARFRFISGRSGTRSTSCSGLVQGLTSLDVAAGIFVQRRGQPAFLSVATNLLDVLWITMWTR